MVPASSYCPLPLCSEPGSCALLLSNSFLGLVKHSSVTTQQSFRVPVSQECAIGVVVTAHTGLGQAADDPCPQFFLSTYSMQMVRLFSQQICHQGDRKSWQEALEHQGRVSQGPWPPANPSPLLNEEGIFRRPRQDWGDSGLLSTGALGEKKQADTF